MYYIHVMAQMARWFPLWLICITQLFLRWMHFRWNCVFLHHHRNVFHLGEVSERFQKGFGEISSPMSPFGAFSILCFKYFIDEWVVCVLWIDIKWNFVVKMLFLSSFWDKSLKGFSTGFLWFVCVGAIQSFSPPSYMVINQSSSSRTHSVSAPHSLLRQTHTHTHTTWGTRKREGRVENKAHLKFYYPPPSNAKWTHSAHRGLIRSFVLNYVIKWFTFSLSFPVGKTGSKATLDEWPPLLAVASHLSRSKAE